MQLCIGESGKVSLRYPTLSRASELSGTCVRKTTPYIVTAKFLSRL